MARPKKVEIENAAIQEDAPIAVAPEPPKRKRLETLFNEPLAIDVDRAQMHQAFHIPAAGTESTLSSVRTRGLQLRYHLGAHILIGLYKGKYFFTPSPNMIVGHEA